MKVLLTVLFVLGFSLVSNAGPTPEQTKCFATFKKVMAKHAAGATDLLNQMLSDGRISDNDIVAYDTEVQPVRSIVVAIHTLCNSPVTKEQADLIEKTFN